MEMCSTYMFIFMQIELIFHLNCFMGGEDRILENWVRDRDRRRRSLVGGRGSYFSGKFVKLGFLKVAFPAFCFIMSACYNVSFCFDLEGLTEPPEPLRSTPGFARRLVFKQRPKVTRKWPIRPDSLNHQ